MCSTTEPTTTNMTTGSDIPPHEDGTSNSLIKQEDNKHIRPLWLTTHPKAQVHKFDCEVDTGAWCTIMSLHIYRSILGDRRLEPPMMIITGYGDSLVANTGLCTALLLTGYQVLRKALFLAPRVDQLHSIGQKADGSLRLCLDPKRPQ